MEVATERVCQSLSIACCAAAGWKDVVKHCVGVVMPPGVLTSHLYAQLLPPWTAAVQTALQSHTRAAVFVGICSGTHCWGSYSELSVSWSLSELP